MIIFKCSRYFYWVASSRPNLNVCHQKRKLGAGGYGKGECRWADRERRTKGACWLNDNDWRIVIHCRSLCNYWLCFSILFYLAVPFLDVRVVLIATLDIYSWKVLIMGICLIFIFHHKRYLVLCS